MKQTRLFIQVFRKTWRLTLELDSDHTCVAPVVAHGLLGARLIRNGQDHKSKWDQDKCLRFTFHSTARQPDVSQQVEQDGFLHD